MTRLLGGEVPTEEGEAARTSRERVVVVPGHFYGLRRVLRLEVVQRPELDRGRRAHRRRSPRKVLVSAVFEIGSHGDFDARPPSTRERGAKDKRESTTESDGHSRFKIAPAES